MMIAGTVSGLPPSLRPSAALERFARHSARRLNPEWAEENNWHNESAAQIKVSIIVKVGKRWARAHLLWWISHSLTNERCSQCSDCESWEAQQHSRPSAWRWLPASCPSVEWWHCRSSRQLKWGSFWARLISELRETSVQLYSEWLRAWPETLPGLWLQGERSLQLPWWVWTNHFAWRWKPSLETGSCHCLSLQSEDRTVNGRGYIQWWVI